VRFLLLLTLAACVENPARRASVRVEGSSVVLESDRELRALVVDLEANTTTCEVGPDAAHLNLVTQGGARVVFADSRRLRLPRRGTILVCDGPVVVSAAEGADDGPESVPVEVR
jgi:hypothetical protein